MSLKLYLWLEGKGYLNLIVIGISLLAILIPLLCGYDFNLLDESPVNNAIMSPQAQTSYGILLVSIIPSVIDTALDFANIFHPFKRQKYIFGRVPIALAGFLVSVQFFVISDSPSIFNLTSNRAASYLFCLSCLKIVFTGSMMTILTSIKPSVFSGRTTFLFTLCTCGVIVIRTSSPGTSASFHQFSNILSYLFLVLIVFAIFYWLSLLMKSLRNMTVPDYICILYLFIYLVIIFGSSLNVFRAWSTGQRVIDFSTMTGEDFAIENYCYTFMYIMLAIAPGRIARFEAVTHLVSSVSCSLYSSHLTKLYTFLPTYMNVERCDRHQTDICTIHRPRAPHAA